MLGLFERIALEGLGDLRISLALRLTRHRKVHSDLAAFAVEMVLKTLCDFRILDLAVANYMLARPSLLAGLSLLDFELRAWNAALGALLRSRIADMYIPANR